MKIPVLAYHSHRIEGNTYETNDHVAFFQDLRTLHGQGFHIVPVSWVVDWVLGQRASHTLGKAVALTLDDGPAFDYYDLEYPPYGMQRSFYHMLQDFQAEYGPTAQPDLHASCFVIASPHVRRELDQRSLMGKNWLHDGWWKDASDSGLLSIYNHSWDHNHPDVSVVCQKAQVKGSFSVIDTYAECQAEIAQAAECIHQMISPTWPDLFAYPWGQSSPYLRQIYFPSYPQLHRTRAAFTTDGCYVTETSSAWNLSRFVCGAPQIGWNSPEDLMRVLHGVGE